MLLPMARIHKQPGRDTPIRDLGLAFRRFFTSTVLLRCPACGQGNVTKNYFEVKDACPVCFAKFKRGDSGNFLVPATINYFITSVVMVGVTVALVLRYGFFGGLVWIVTGLAVVTALLIYRPVQALSLWLLWVFGFIYPD